MKTSALPLLLALCAAHFPCLADEGMWLLNRFPAAEVQKKYGVQVSGGFLNHLQLASVRFNNGGSGSFVSSEGLLFTNHHVGADCIYKVSSKEHDYMKDGFHARSRSEEKACPDLEINILLKAETITEKVTQGITAGTPPAEANQIRLANIARLESECNKATGNRCDVVTLYSGGQYDLYQYKKYTDVRLVFAPEESIAAFGGDPDNFTFPRYCLDFALFRAYENGQPVKPQHFLKWSKTGAQNNELIFVTGHPGKTERLATVAELEFQRDVAQPASLQFFEKMISRLLAFGAENPENKRIARDLLAGFQNSYKARSGFQRGLTDPEFMKLKKDAETRLRKAIADDPVKQKRFGAILDEIEKYTVEYRKFYKPFVVLENSPAAGSELFGLARGLIRYTAEKPKPNTDRLRDYSDSALPAKEQALFSTAPIYPSLEELTLAVWFRRMAEYLGPEDALLRKILDGKTVEQAAKYYVSGSKLADVAERKRLAGHLDAVASSSDTMIRLAQLVDPEGRRLRKLFEEKVEAVQTSSASRIAQARFAVYGANEYPDATFTLRVTYAAIKGYTNAAGAAVPWATDFRGLFARASGEEPFVLPPSFLKAKSKLRQKTPFNFVSTADTHGGNSGSPTVNAKGELVGILFDGNIEGLPNQYLYRDRTERSVHVASQGIVEALRNVYQARGILQEIGF